MIKLLRPLPGIVPPLLLFLHSHYCRSESQQFAFAPPAPLLHPLAFVRRHTLPIFIVRLAGEEEDEALFSLAVLLLILHFGIRTNGY